jgi:hypothetical protein
MSTQRHLLDEDRRTHGCAHPPTPSIVRATGSDGRRSLAAAGFKLRQGRPQVATTPCYLHDLPNANR